MKDIVFRFKIIHIPLALWVVKLMCFLNLNLTVHIRIWSKTLWVKTTGFVFVIPYFTIHRNGKPDS